MYSIVHVLKLVYLGVSEENTRMLLNAGGARLLADWLDSTDYLLPLWASVSLLAIAVRSLMNLQKIQDSGIVAKIVQLALHSADLGHDGDEHLGGFVLPRMIIAVLFACLRFKDECHMLELVLQCLILFE